LIRPLSYQAFFTPSCGMPMRADVKSLIFKAWETPCGDLHACIACLRALGEPIPRQNATQILLVSPRVRCATRKSRCCCTCDRHAQLLCHAERSASSFEWRRWRLVFERRGFQPYSPAHRLTRPKLSARRQEVRRIKEIDIRRKE
jgi:hypothetical protein